MLHPHRELMTTGPLVAERLAHHDVVRSWTTTTMGGGNHVRTRGDVRERSGEGG